MSEQSFKNGYTGYEGMGKPIPRPHRQSACEVCLHYGLDKKTAGDLVTKMARLLEHNKPHDASLSARSFFSITKIYHLINVLMTGET